MVPNCADSPSCKGSEAETLHNTHLVQRKDMLHIGEGNVLEQQIGAHRQLTKLAILANRLARALLQRGFLHDCFSRPT